MLGALIDHVLYITSLPEPKFILLASLIPHIYALTKAYPTQSAEHFVNKLAIMNKNLKRGLAQGATNAHSRTWPGLPEISLLHTIGLVWPTSDMNHPVVTPARLLMGSYLGLCRVRSISDVACGLFLCTLFLRYEELSERFVPEVINFLTNTVLHIAPHDFQDAESLPGSFSSPGFRPNRSNPLCLETSIAKKASSHPPSLAGIVAGTEDVSKSKVDLLGLAINLLERFSVQYKSLEAFVDLFSPVSTILGRVKADQLSTSFRVCSI